MMTGGRRYLTKSHPQTADWGGLSWSDWQDFDGAHRNTVLNRLQRAERLLPLPLAGHGLEVGVALEIAQWLGTQPGSATHAW